MSSKKLAIWILGFLILVLNVGVTYAAPKAELWARWEAHDPRSKSKVDHTSWAGFLQKYLVRDHPSGVNLVRYKAVTPRDKILLGEYLEAMQGVLVSELARPEQEAFWINLYNALTVKVILDHYPVKSILEINISPGWFSKGPWDAKLLRIEGEEVSLNDIEHRILRPIWKDNRVHYALNCASMSCPNLRPEAFTAENTQDLLERGAKEYVNHPRGARLEEDVLVLSSIYDWYQADFAGSRSGVIQHLIKYAGSPLAKALGGFNGRIRYKYDWSLNEAP